MTEQKYLQRSWEKAIRSGTLFSNLRLKSLFVDRLLLELYPDRILSTKQSILRLQSSCKVCKSACRVAMTHQEAASTFEPFPNGS